MENNKVMVKRLCGHEDTIPRDMYDDPASAMMVCDKCAADGRIGRITSSDFAELVGSPKQIAWASDIRLGAARECIRSAAAVQDDRFGDWVRAALGETSAKWWIEHSTWPDLEMVPHGMRLSGDARFANTFSKCSAIEGLHGTDSEIWSATKYAPGLLAAAAEYGLAMIYRSFIVNGCDDKTIAEKIKELESILDALKQEGSARFWKDAHDKYTECVTPRRLLTHGAKLAGMK